MDYSSVFGKGLENILRFGTPQGLALTAGQALLGQYKGPFSDGQTSDASIGRKVDDPRLGIRYYAGPNYGDQTPGSFVQIDPTRATSDPREQAELRTIQAQVRQGLADAQKQLPKPSPNTAGTGPVQDTSRTASAGVPPLPGRNPVDTSVPQTTDPQLNKIFDELKRLTDPEYRAQVTQQDLEAEVKRALITNALSLRQTREKTRRETEIANIEAWRELEKARIQANSQQAAVLGIALAQSLAPNTGLMSAINSAYQSSLAPFNNFTLK